jgi:hypothetical protein
MEDNVACGVWSGHTKDLSDIFKDNKTEWNVFPEEPRIKIKFYQHFPWRRFLQVLILNRQHREWDS